ncbi:MAG: alkaline phosphatase [Streptosporangiales bacterium]|nr:alkaline phosphatase [Streptosporangiales bacterium]
MTGSSALTSRRRFITTAGSVLVGAATATLAPSWAHAAQSVANPRLRGEPFTLGVASGDPEPHSVVLWTRLAPEPLHGGGMPDRPVPVQWQVACDERFTCPVASGTEFARPEYAHSVHVEAGGLDPDREYFYRFRAGDRVSPVGRTRTAPPHDAATPVRFAVASCQNWQNGYFTPLAHLADQDVAVVFFLGDYIYESKPHKKEYVRQHEGDGEPMTLEQYRNRYAQYRTDPNLQAAHANAPWVVTFDDHEVDNNYAADVPQDPDDQSHKEFRKRRKAAMRAYFEHMPLRYRAHPHGAAMRLYRGLRFGRHVRVSVLDTRQYRSDQPRTLQEAKNPALSITGKEQERWLLDRLTDTSATWNLVANQAMIAQNDRLPGRDLLYDLDNWDGYRVQRRRLLSTLHEADAQNVVFMTGDRHSTWVCDLRPDFEDEKSPVVGAELTGTSISSGGNPDLAAFHSIFDPIKAKSPHWKFIDHQRGFLLCHADKDQLTTELRVVSSVTQPKADGGTYATFVVESGRPGVEVRDVAPRPLLRLRGDPEMGPGGPLPLSTGWTDPRKWH